MPRKESTKDKKCGKCGATIHPGNNPAWYTREGLTGMVGANFAALTSVNDIAVGDNSLRTNTGIRFRTLIGCPSDTNGSFMKMMNQMYAEIREKNSGAANYTPRILGAYIHDVMTLRALYISACRTLAAVRSSQPGSADSPYYLTAVTTRYGYKPIASEIANFSNALRLIGKDMSVLPVPTIAMFDREEFLYGRVFADSQNGKAAMMAFVPQTFVTRVNVKEDGSYDYGVVQHNIDTDLLNFSDLIAYMQTMLLNISANSTIAILRGDLIKAYGYIGVDMSQYVDKPLTVEYNRTVLSQIENMNILHTTVTVTEESVFGTLYSGNFVVTAGNSPAIPQRCDDTEWMINFHDGMAPDSGTLLSITRNMAYTDSKKLVHSSGDPILGVEMILSVNSLTESVNYDTLVNWISNINSTTQSTAEEALRKIANMSAIVDGFPWVWTGSGEERKDFAYIWDVDMWAIITRNQLEQMNEQCIRSLFYYRAPRVDGMIKPGRL